MRLSDMQQMSEIKDIDIEIGGAYTSSPQRRGLMKYFSKDTPAPSITPEQPSGLPLGSIYSTEQKGMK